MKECCHISCWRRTTFSFYLDQRFSPGASLHPYPFRDAMVQGLPMQRPGGTALHAPYTARWGSTCSCCIPMQCLLASGTVPCLSVSGMSIEGRGRPRRLWQKQAFLLQFIQSGFAQGKRGSSTTTRAVATATPQLRRTEAKWGSTTVVLTQGVSKWKKIKL